MYRINYQQVTYITSPKVTYTAHWGRSLIIYPTYKTMKPKHQHWCVCHQCDLRSHNGAEEELPFNWRKFVILRNKTCYIGYILPHFYWKKSKTSFSIATSQLHSPKHALQCQSVCYLNVLLWTVLHCYCVTRCIVSCWPLLATWASFPPLQLAKIDLSVLTCR